MGRLTVPIPKTKSDIVALISCTRGCFDFVIIDGLKASLFRAGRLAEQLKMQANF